MKTKSCAHKQKDSYTFNVCETMKLRIINLYLVTTEGSAGGSRGQSDSFICVFLFSNMFEYDYVFLRCRGTHCCSVSGCVVC